MTKSAEHILEEALALDATDRMELVDRLSETLEPNSDPEYTGVAWEAEGDSRTHPAKLSTRTRRLTPIPWQAGELEQIGRGEGDGD